jgi:D-aminopeptidase
VAELGVIETPILLTNTLNVPLVAERRADDSSRAPGSIMMIVGTDAPLDARQLTRIARRAALGLARTGSPAGHSSGDFVIAFSNGNLIPHRPTQTVLDVRTLAEDGPAIGELFQATVESVEEAILNSLFRAETVVGCDGHVREGLPIERIGEIFERHGRRLTIA